MAELDELEGQGQAKRLTARICATLKNELDDFKWLYRASKIGEKAGPPPKPIDESAYLPRRVRIKRPKPSQSMQQSGKPSTGAITRAQAISRRISEMMTESFGFPRKEE